MLTDRQQTILKSLVNEYVRLAEPISSQFLEKEYDFGIHRAMIRREMQELAERGYLFQPHTSAGKIPTDKGYRFVVDIILRDEDKERDRIAAEELWNGALQENLMEEALKQMYLLTRSVAEESSALTLGYLKSEDVSWREGWEEILQEPEFKDAACVNRLIRALDKIEQGLTELKTPAPIKVYIGEENPFAKIEDFSTLIVGFQLAEEEKGALAIIGPKRMPYKRNIKLLESLSNFINSLK